MKIVYIIANTNLYGSELHLYDLIKKNHISNQIKLIAFSNGPLIELIKNDFNTVEIVIVDVTWSKGIFKLFQIRNEIIKFSPHIVHSHQPLAIFWGSLSSRISKTKHISTVHSLPYGNALEYVGLKSKIVYAFQCFIQFIAEYLSDRSIFITHYNARNFSFIKSKAVVIYNWVSDRFIPKSKLKHSKTDDCIKFLSACSINKGKGLMELLLIFNEIKNKINFTWTIAGVGDENLMNEMREFIINNELENNVVMAGYQTDLSSFYQDADFFALLTKGEAFGLVFVEAMKFSLPIICTNLPQLKEIIPEGNLFVDINTGFEDTVIQKILDDSYKQKIGLLNCQTAQALFNIDSQISKVNDLYRQVTMTGKGNSQ
jgi:glycosyltransferase involved in cell wall biosynthesis